MERTMEKTKEQQALEWLKRYVEEAYQDNEGDVLIYADEDGHCAMWEEAKKIVEEG
jgi:hypothetical protein